MKKLQPLLYLLLFCLIAIITAATVFIVLLQSPAPGPFTIHLFAEQNSHLPEAVNWGEENSWKLLLDMDLSHSDLVLEEDDIISYDWSTQKIRFNSDSREQFGQKMKRGGPYGYYVVSLSDTPIVGGAILPIPSAVAPRMPVIYHNAMMPISNATELELFVPSYSADDLSQYNMIHSWMEGAVKQRMEEIGKLTQQPSESFAIHVFAEDNSLIPDSMDPAKEDNWNFLTNIDLSQSELILLDPSITSP